MFALFLKCERSEGIQKQSWCNLILQKGIFSFFYQSWQLIYLSLPWQDVLKISISFCSILIFSLISAAFWVLAWIKFTHLFLSFLMTSYSLAKSRSLNNKMMVEWTLNLIQNVYKNFMLMLTLIKKNFLLHIFYSTNNSFSQIVYI